MTGREFVSELERAGFSIKRRCKSFVWIARGEQTLMLDEEATVPDKFLQTVLGTRRHSLAPASRPSMRAASNSGRPSRRP